MTTFLLIITSLFLLFMLYTNIKNRPDLFSSKNINNSFFTMGILAIILIIMISLTVIVLRK